jgi:type IV fimbrial biogenesis protein FimT
MRSTGFTLIELMIVIALAAILLGLGVPGFQQLMANNRITSLTNDFVTALSFARSEAIKRGRQVSMCKSNDGATCDSTLAWNDGWIVFTDGGTEGDIDGTDLVLRVGGSLEAVAIDGGANFGDWISYRHSGVSKGSGGLANGTIGICISPRGRNVIVSATGRVRVSETTC